MPDAPVFVTCLFPPRLPTRPARSGGARAVTGANGAPAPRRPVRITPATG